MHVYVFVYVYVYVYVHVVVQHCTVICFTVLFPTSFFFVCFVIMTLSNICDVRTLLLAVLTYHLVLCVQNKRVLMEFIHKRKAEKARHLLLR